MLEIEFVEISQYHTNKRIVIFYPKIAYQS